MFNDFKITEKKNIFKMVNILSKIIQQTNDLNVIQKFVKTNHTGNANPLIIKKRNATSSIIINI